MNLSYWEYKSWLTDVDFCIVGSGIVGLNCALHLKVKFPKAKVLVLERGSLPQGASTKNAGFACFGSLSEILDDLKSHSEEKVLELIQKRIQGLKLLRQNLGDASLDYKALGGYELFPKDGVLYEECQSQKERINALLYPMFDAKVFNFQNNKFGFKNCAESYSFNPFEGQIDTGKMMSTLLQKVQCLGVNILNRVEVKSFSEEQDSVKINTCSFEFSASNMLIATNGFASTLGIMDVKPSRNQVLITKPISKLHIQGTFHLEQGYYYFRNIHNRILLGGGRHLDKEGETTSQQDTTLLIQNALEQLLSNTILPDIPYEIDYRWSGILGTGIQKSPILKPLSSRIFCGVRLGGMGVAIGSLVGKELAELPQKV